MKRREFLLGGAAVSVAGALAFKPADNGAPYSDYFSTLNTGLKDQGKYVPQMMVDLDLLDHNIITLQKQLNTEVDFRIVAKSLPSPELLGYVMEKASTNRLMVFHLPFLSHVASAYPSSDLLLGKPMPVKAAQRFYADLSDNGFDASTQLQWLIDSQDRLEQYLEMAKHLGLKLQLNFEIDVGLHRGGFQQPAQLDKALALVQNNSEHISFSGFMGYDPHVVKLPSIIKSKDQAYVDSQAIYQRFIEHLYAIAPEYKTQKLCFNGAGSPTLAMHQATTVCNELAAGSCLVKPTDFDIPTLASFKAAAFIASPILKKSSGTLIPAIEGLKNIFPLWDPNTEQTFFIYGGKWMADYESPQGLQANNLFGSSTNQQIINGSHNVDLDVDEHVFLRPAQSEFVFLQFGDIQAVRNGKLVADWPILRQS